VARSLDQAHVLEPRVAQERGRGLGRAAHLGGGEAFGRHARDPHQLGEPAERVVEVLLSVRDRRGHFGS